MRTNAERGVAAVEFALITSILLLILFGTAEVNAGSGPLQGTEGAQHPVLVRTAS